MKPAASPPDSIDDYISRFPPDIRQILQKIRTAVHEAAPQAEERISYGMPAFYQNGGLVWFGAYRRHIDFYPRQAEMEANIEGLAAYPGTKGSIHFPLDRPVPYDLIRKIVEFRLAENSKG